MDAPLSDIKVLDFSTLLPGPMASLILAETGADMIKIERPDGGDGLRTYPPKWGDDSVSFALLNRGKKSLALDLKEPAARARLLPFFRETDIVLEQFRPGVMDRLGLGYRDLIKIKPDLIYCAITGYGQSGSKRHRAGHDLNYIGDAGLLSLSMGTREQPVVPPALIADIAGGSYPAVMNILLALRHRDRTGEGVFLDIAMTDNLFPFMFWALGEGQATGRWPGNGQGALAGGSPRYQLYPTSDDETLTVAALEEKFWKAFCEAIDLDPPLRNDASDPATTRQAIAEIIESKPADHWRRVFEDADCCCTIVQSIELAVSDAHFQARGLFDAKLKGSDGDTMAALPVPVAKVFRADPEDPQSAPALGNNDDN
ncbi:MAG: CaiB/BaiF CoA transferase family protein [Geminicoccaceae bacterium]